MRMDKTQTGAETLAPRAHAVLEIDGCMVEIDVYGHLVDPTTWSRAVVVHMAESDGVELVEDHWLLIDFLNRFYTEFGIAPELAILSRCLCKDQGECRWTRRYIKTLFPGGARTACRYAGLPVPVGRSCG